MNGPGAPGGHSVDQLILLLVGVVAAVYVFTHLGDLGAAAVTWLLAHDVLVRPAAALVNLPSGIEAGLDARRLVLLAGVLVLVVVLGLHRRSSARLQS